MIELTRWEIFKAVIAKWIVVQIAARISPMAVVALMLDVHELYVKEQQAELEKMEAVEPNE
jgi:hypothetical protein